MSVLALGWVIAQLLATGATVATALGAGLAMAARGERQRRMTLPRTAPQSGLSAQTLALMERVAD